jgi:hypothetical protein
VGIVGTVGAELMAISCAWLVASERKPVAGVAMVCQVILTAVLLVNAAISLDLDWRETLAEKAVERHMMAGRLVAEEQRKTLEKQAELALQLLEKDKRLARAFVRAEREPESKLPPPPLISETAPAVPLEVQRLSLYERYGLTVMPLFLALLAVIALAMAAQSGAHSAMLAAEMPELAASVEMGTGAAPFVVNASPRSARGSTQKETLQNPPSVLFPAEKKSVTLGRYQFRKDGVGWQCRESVGRGSHRKRPYLAYLSRTAYEAMQAKAPTREQLEEALLQWADQKREEKQNGSLPF